MRAAIESHDGHEIDTAGDGFFVAFERAGDALAAAIEAQRALFAEESDAVALRVRMGLHSAEPYLHEGSYVGVGVHRAARICAAGHGGQILLSNATAGIVEDLDLPEVVLVDLGEHRLKDLVGLQRLFQCEVEGLESEFPALRTLDSDQQHPEFATVLMVDVVGWATVIRTLGDERAAVGVHAFQDIVVARVRAAGGRELEVVADNVVSVFDRPRDALQAATDIREEVRSGPWISDVPALPVRMAVHSGRFFDSGGRHLGSAFLRCGLLCAVADPWQILVSHATEALVEGEILDLTIRDAGNRTLKGTEEPVRVFEVEA